MLSRLRRPELAVVIVWLALGTALAALTTRVVDWFVMTDELLYERLALSVDRLHSPLPEVHGVLVPNVSQLYPLLLSIVYAQGKVPAALHDAHLLNAFVMSSVAVPAFLLARRAAAARGPAFFVAALSVCVPWIVYACFLLTEVAAYPAFVWSMLAIQRTCTKASVRADLLALAAIGLAVLARSEFVSLLAVLPAVLVLYELAGEAGAGRWRRAPRLALRHHRALAGAYALLIAGWAGAVLIAHVPVLGTYSDTVHGSLVPAGLARSLLEHFALLSLSLALLPVLLGVAWLLSTLVRPVPGEAYAFALTASVGLLVLLVEGTIFDLRFGAGVAHDRYLFYAAPLLLTAFVCALVAPRWPRWSLLAPLALTVGGLLVARLPVYGRLNVDTPASDIDRYLRRTLHTLTETRIVLVLAALLVTALFLQGARLLPRRLLAGVLVGVVLVALPAETAFAFSQLFDYPGTSGRPLTLNQGNVFDWIDQLVGTGGEVTMLPYPFINGQYWASTAYWWDVEFWNESVDRAAYIGGAFEGTPSTFPKLALRFDQRTGIANIDPTRYVVELSDDARVRLYGNTLLLDRGALLIDTGGGPWRADWISRGLTDDGWTLPGRRAVLRLYPEPFQPRPILRHLIILFESPAPDRPISVVSNLGRWHGTASPGAGTYASVEVCQPPGTYTDVAITSSGSSLIYGDMRNVNTFGQERRAGVLVSNVDLSGTTPCARR